MKIQHLFDMMNEQNFPSINKKLEYLENYLLVCYSDSDEENKDLKHKFSYFKTETKRDGLKQAVHQTNSLKIINRGRKEHLKYL